MDEVYVNLTICAVCNDFVPRNISKAEVKT